MVDAYATAPDDVALDGTNTNHSPFSTAALIKEMQERGLEIETLFRRVARDVNESTGGRQRPETSISVLSEYYLKVRSEALGEYGTRGIYRRSVSYCGATRTPLAPSMRNFGSSSWSGPSGIARTKLAPGAKLSGKSWKNRSYGARRDRSSSGGAKAGQRSRCAARNLAQAGRAGAAFYARRAAQKREAGSE